MTQPQTIKINIAGYEVCPVPTGLFGLDGGAMFGVVPKVLWQKSNPADENNRIPMEARALLLKSKDRAILIDTGNGSDFIAKYGEKMGSKFSEMYALDKSGPNLISSLKKYDLEPEQITDVILTHLHFDHAGGATTERNGKIVPTFPNAKYYVQKKNLQTALHPNIREKSSYFAINYQPLIDHNCLIEVDGNQKNIIPGISLMISNGHTEAHQVVIIEDSETALYYCGDVVPTSSHVRLAWVMGYDLYPMQLIEEKKNLLEQALQKKTYLYFEHDPYCDAATIERNKDDFAVKERFLL
ncbi:MAG: MBL fold metallo-hydrolase [Bdellovibrionales bacterium RIFCSPHIGHO2_01_FULL_40_29]|nr:MAG: MBL fold metallo-hydrolase [Bdellovibrionales bacterium RIFCSPHIGHO2_01_FULL_40_29]OFZ33856.1 MAG: MBL fold metallo-hydrolase [Bdellovibrionales bacterium RIFCSPHIGHO2_02_FULL_40_15]